jgi:hypothetical protein
MSTGFLAGTMNCLCKARSRLASRLLTVKAIVKKWNSDLWLAGLCLVSLALSAPVVDAADYHVGPGQALGTIGEAPWASLQPGDRVLIHWREAPYNEKWVINRRGTPEAWITVRGVPGPEGQLPVIDGRDAVTAPGLDFWNEERGIIKIGGSNTPPDDLPAYLVIENLEIRSGRPPFTFTNDGGGTSSYVDNAASIYVEKAEHLIVRHCVIHDSGNGIFTGTSSSRATTSSATAISAVPSITTPTLRRSASSINTIDSVLCEPAPTATISRTARRVWSCATTGSKTATGSSIWSTGPPTWRPTPTTTRLSSTATC